MNDEYALTTYDNPFDPFDDFNSWYKYDMIYGYDTCGLLARTSNVNDLASEEVQNQQILDAMDEIVFTFPMIFRKVKKGEWEFREIAM